MAKTIKEVAEENKEVSLEQTNFRCYNCNSMEVTVYLHEENYTREWPFCDSCGSRENHVLSGLANRGIEING